MQICPSEKCTGCYACIAACPHKCITMQEDLYGELHPIVNEKDCIQCGVCQRVCPNNTEQVYHYPHKCYASWIIDKEKRRICASGGIGTIMSEYIIEHCDGIVFGSRYDEDMTPIMTFTEQKEELERFKGSRYVQSMMSDGIYDKLRSYLKDGRKVLFVGTPCQIAGVKNYLKREWDNLVTVDLICHGCVPTRYFIDEVSHICTNKHLKDLSDVRFRGNDGNNYALSLWGKKIKNSCSKIKQKRRLYYKKGCTSYYLAGFLLGITLRENCYRCQYSRPERISDITIGDFIGLGKEVPFKYPKGNVSSVLLNTEKGMLFYNSVTKNCHELINIERHYEERLNYKPSLVEPFKKHELYDVFRELYKEEGYIKASRLVLKDIVKQYKKKNLIKEIRLILLLPYRVLRKLVK